MRITNLMMVENAIQHMADNNEKINLYSERIATRKQFQNASDDPVGASYCLNLRSTLKTTDGYKIVADQANDWMSANEFAFEQLETIGLRAVNLVQRGLNDTLSAEERASALATEIDKIIQQTVDLGNYSHNGQYLFAGTKTKTRPFSMPDADTVMYDGNEDQMYRTVGVEQTIEMNVTGKTTIQPLIEALIQARNNLNDNDVTALNGTITELQSSLDAIDVKRTSNGARMRRVETAVDYLDKAELEVKALLSKKEDTNMAEAISMLRAQETAYEAVLEVSQRSISAMNLFDYMS